jgi:regulator of sigma E protease
VDILSFAAATGGTLITIAAFVVALSIIVFVHEYGHYIVARWSGIHAEAFSLGFGPVLVKWHDKRGTQWQIAALPLGGFVRFKGDAGPGSDKDDAAIAEMSETERRATLAAAPLWARTATVAAGPAFNFLMSIIVFAGIFMVIGVARDAPIIDEMRPVPSAIANELQPGDRVISAAGVATPDLETLMFGDFGTDAEVTYAIDRGGDRLMVTGPNPRLPVIDTVQPGAPADDAGLRRGDVISAIDGTPIGSFAQLQETVAASGAQGASVDLTVWRDGAAETVTLTPRMQDIPAGDGWEQRPLIGIAAQSFFDPATDTPGLLRALWMGMNQTWSIVTMSLDGVWHIVTGAISSCNLQGPIGIAELSGAAAQQGLGDFIWLIAVLSTAIGLVNLFPIPVLDGGHLVFYGYEALRGRPPPPRVYQLLTALGLAAILTLMVFAVSNDLFCP